MSSESGEIYRIFVSFPAAEPPANGFPVLYVLDGNASFASFAETRRIQEHDPIGKSIVVGVGYPTEDAYDVRRLNDYTPPLHSIVAVRFRRYEEENHMNVPARAVTDTLRFVFETY